jgi:hypothetical protein
MVVRVDDVAEAAHLRVPGVLDLVAQPQRLGIGGAALGPLPVVPQDELGFAAALVGPVQLLETDQRLGDPRADLLLAEQGHHGDLGRVQVQERAPDGGP